MSLRTQQHCLIQRLANCIEESWHHYLELTPYAVPEGLGYVEGSLEGERLFIENSCWQTPQFRKLHLELAQVGNGLDVLHCVMFPRPEYALPIFGVDLVGRRQGGITAAIADLSPITADYSLPQAYNQALSQLPKLPFSSPRVLPAWGHIFSNFCVFVRPVGSQEEEQFLGRVRDFITLHCQIAKTEPPLTSDRAITEVMVGQQNYCTQQQKNDKTRRVLEKSFGSEWTDRYISTMLFDLEAAEHQSSEADLHHQC